MDCDFPALRPRSVSATVVAASLRASTTSVSSEAANAEGTERGKRKRVNSGEKAEHTLMEEIRDISHSLKMLMMSMSKRSTTSLNETVSQKITELEVVVYRALFENEYLRGQLAECRASEEKIRLKKVSEANTYARVTASCLNRAAAAPTAAVSQNIRRQDKNVSAKKVVNVAQRHAIVVRPRDKSVTSEEVREKVLKEVQSAMTYAIKVKAVRKIRSGGITIETSSATELQKLRECKKFEEAGLVVESPRVIGPKVIVYDVPNDMTAEYLMKELYERNLSDVCD